MIGVEAYLPADLQGPGTTITRIAAGLSGAGVYRVEANGRAFVLKVSTEGDRLERWRRKVQVLQSAASAGIAPRVVHTDEARRAVLTELVVDRSFPAFFMDPRTRDAALALLGQTLRRVHELPLPPEAEAQEPRDALASTWAELGAAGFTLPTFVGDSIQRVLAEQAPARERPLVLSHNDVNPSNLVYDGERLLLLDWDVAAPNDPLYDLATISVFLRMDEETCRRLLAAHDGAAVAVLPAGLTYNRCLVAALCGATILRLARKGGHPGATGQETLDTTPSLGEVFQRMRAGTLSPATTEGQWSFGLALVKTSAIARLASDTAT